MIPSHEVDCYHTDVLRTQISLTEQQMARLRDAAWRRGVSIAAIVREAVAAYLDRDPEDLERRKARALAAAGRFADDADDVAAHHDEYLAESVAEQKASRR